jgi:hypothetical protein
LRIHIILPLVVLCVLFAPPATNASDTKITVKSISKGGRISFRITHSDWPDDVWVYRLPETFVILNRTNNTLSESVVRDDSTGTVTLTGRTPPPAEIEYTFTLRPEGDVVHLGATLFNGGRFVWDDFSSVVACLVFAGAPRFVDPLMTRTFGQFDGRLMSIKRMNKHFGRKFHYPHHKHSLRAAPSKGRRGGRRSGTAATPIRADCSLIIRSSKDGKHHVGVAWDDAVGIAYNFTETLNCAHSTPRVGALAPGEWTVRRGRLYFFTGSLEELLQRFEADFPNRGYGTEIAK